MTAYNWKEMCKMLENREGEGEEGEWLANAAHANLLS